MKKGIELGIICIVCIIGVFCSGCFGSNPEKPVTPAPPSDTPQTLNEISTNTSAEKAVVDANNKFSLKLYSHLVNDPRFANQTVFFSPFSISSALAITYEGARGNTAEEIQSVFFFPKDSNQRRSGFVQLYKDINQGNSQYILKTANALWAEKTYPFLPDYVDTVRIYYHANATNLDFKNQPEKSRITINIWVEDQTNNKIKDLIPVGAIDPLTRLVITNAVYFKGKWVKPFDKNQSKDDIFYITPGNTVHVQMMEMTDKRAILRYTETDTLQALDMLYTTDSKKQVSMLILLPKNKDLASIEDAFTIEKLSEINTALVSQRVNVTFPKFKLETKYSLSRTLTSMGLLSAFTDQADFSGMEGKRNLYIGDVIHQAFIEVNEEGTEAAAATGVIMGTTAVLDEPLVPEFRADHPFIFIIQDSETGNILFMGRVSNPNG